jgi:hypothetical protein
VSRLVPEHCRHPAVQAGGGTDAALRSRQRLYGLRFDALVLHCPLPQRVPSVSFHTEWEAACAAFFSDLTLRDAFHAVDDLTVVTINTRPERCLLERCFEHLGLPLVVLGDGVTEWSWAQKIVLVVEWLRHGGCTTSELLYLDGDDVLVIAELAEIQRRWRRIDCDLLFCATRGDWPPDAACLQFEDQAYAGSDPQHRHLNAGGWIGRTPYIEECLEEIDAARRAGASWCHARHGFDDQLAWRQLHRREHPRMRVDADCTVFVRFDEDR